MMAKIPEKLFFKIGEVCELTETQPYVLRFWESEFPQLAPKKNRSGQRIYSSEDIEVVQEIKRLLYESGFTIAGARKQLEEGPSEPAASKKAPAKAAAKKSSKAKVAAPPAEAKEARVQVHEGNGGHDVAEELREILELMAENDKKLG
jgi:DNA-binding transcriptional MerR regulator